MIIGRYDTKRGKRVCLDLSTGKSIKGLTDEEFKEIWNGIVNRQRAKDLR